MRKITWERLGLALTAWLLVASCGKSPPAQPSQSSSAPETTAKAPAPAATPPAPQLPTQPPQFHFAVQAGAFKSHTRAEALSLRLSGRYQRTTFVTPARVNGRTFYRVRILVETRTGAKSLANSLTQTESPDVWIVASAAETTAKAPASTPPSAPPSTQPTQFHFAVQAGAFKSHTRAEALSLRLSGRYQRTTLVSPVEAGGKTLYRVRILVEKKAEAHSLANSLTQEEKLGVWIVALR